MTTSDSPRQPNGRFAPGHVANPLGRPKGSGPPLDVRLRRMIAEQAPQLVERLLKQAEDGDTCAALGLLDYVLNPHSDEADIEALFDQTIERAAREQAKGESLYDA